MVSASNVTALIQATKNSYVVHRVVVGAFSFGVIVLGARIIEAEGYASLMLSMFFAKFLQILNLGTISGYFVSRYSKTGVLADADLKTEGQYTVSLSLQVLTLAGVILVGAYLASQAHALAILGFIVTIPLIAIEPLLRYRRYFSFSLLPDLLLAMSFATATGIYWLGIMQSHIQVIFVVALVVYVAIALLFTSMRLGALGLPLTRSPLALRSHVSIALTGMPVYVGTLLFVLASSVDRLFLPLYGAAQEVAVYFLAYQIAVGGLLLVSSANFIHSVDLGALVNSDVGLSREALAKVLIRASGIAALCVAVIAVCTLVLERMVLSDVYQGLTMYTVALAGGLSVFFVAGSVTPVLGYLKRQMPATLCMGLVLVCLILNNVFVHSTGRGVTWLPLVTGIALATYALWSATFAMRLVGRKPSGVPNA